MSMLDPDDRERMRREAESREKRDQEAQHKADQLLKRRLDDLQKNDAIGPAGPQPDPLADAVRALKMAELALMSNLAGVTARRAEIKKLRGEVARLYLEAVGRKARTRKAASK